MSYFRRALGEFRMPYVMRRNLRKSPLGTEHWDGIVWYSPSIFNAPLVRSLKSRNGCSGYLIIRDIFPEWTVDLGLMRRGPVYYYFKWVAHQQYKEADTIGVQTPGNLGYFKNWEKSRQGRSLEVLQNWLGPAPNKRCPIRLDETTLRGRIIFVYAGNMGIAQGMDIFVDLAERMVPRKEVGFVFVGRGTDAKRISEIAKSRALDNVLFFDEIDPDEIPDLYSQCSAGIVALDPRNKSHNIPGKFLTYMQNGLPVLANVNEGNDLAQIIASANVGEACETNRIEDLASRFDVLMNLIEADPRLCDRCLDLFKRQFSAEQAVQQISSALQS